MAGATNDTDVSTDSESDCITGADAGPGIAHNSAGTKPGIAYNSAGAKPGIAYNSAGAGPGIAYKNEPWHSCFVPLNPRSWKSAIFEKIFCTHLVQILENFKFR